MSQKPSFVRRKVLVEEGLQKRFAMTSLTLSFVCCVLYGLAVSWHVSLEPTEDSVLAFSFELGVFLLLTFLLFAAIYWVGIVSSHRVAGPLHNLLRQFKEISNGNLNVVSKFRKNDDIHYVSEGFNEMVSKLKGRDEALRGQVVAAMRKLDAGDIVAAREVLSQALENGLFRHEEQTVQIKVSGDNGDATRSRPPTLVSGY